MNEDQPQNVVECVSCAGRAHEKPKREDLLSELVIGDIFKADHLYLVVGLEPDAIRARRLIVPEERRFNVVTGDEMTEGSVGRSSILSVEPLPPDIYNMILWLDRKNRLLTDMSKVALSDPEKQALLFVADHYASNPI